MKKILVVMVAGFLMVTALSEVAHAGGGNKERNLLIATSALGGTLAGAVLGIFADRAFLVNSPLAERPQTISSASMVYQQPAPGYTPPAQNNGYQPSAVAVAPIYVAPSIYPPDPQVTGYSDGYLEGLRRGRQQRYYDARHQGYEAGYQAGLGR